MAITDDDILRTTVNWALADGTVMQNVFHHRRYGVSFYTDAAQIAAIELWCSDMYDEIVAQVRNNVAEQLCTIDKIAFSAGEWIITENVGTFTPTWAPTGAGDALPNQVAAFVVGKTARPKTVGRKFLIPFIEQEQAAGYLVAGAVTAVVAWGDDYINDIVLFPVTDGFEPGVPRTGVDAWMPFTVGVVTNLVGSQRRRRPGVGS